MILGEKPLFTLDISVVKDCLSKLFNNSWIVKLWKI